ncbi:amino acid permease [Labrenzia sp. PHM005]|uniref:amino acid permease n=1 Tax=Labrenzia sp. PHM005 TaxID=2590016 RepID=UPI00113FFE0E|nr:amino acid permease [Labrenzia sp. PHM005]QDG74705.1 amino acid permease [Labrenzia sp. PHM005]
MNDASSVATEPKPQKSAAAGQISVLGLAMMTVAAVVSLRGLPLMAVEGTTLLFYIGFAAFIFLIPAALVAAELGGMFAHSTGGIYDWVKAPFGARAGFVAIWLQWIQNVVWYPTVLAFAAASLAYVIGRPSLADNGIYTGTVIIAAYWFATAIALTGTSAAARFTSAGFLLGTVVPGLLIIALGAAWIADGHTMAFLTGADGSTTSASHLRFFPHITGLSSLAFLGGIVLLFAGVEVHAVHANELKNPSRDFPKAILLSVLIIVALFLLGSLALASIVPANKIALDQGPMQAFDIALTDYGLGWLVPVLALLIALGALAGVMSWITGPSRGLLRTAKDGELPPFLARTNKNGVQVMILLIQGTIVTLLALLYFVLKNVSVAFFLLSAMTITLYLVMYMMMYAAAVRLRITRPDAERSYQVPGGLPGMLAISGLGFGGVAFAFVTSFFPPSQLPVGSPATYVGVVAAGFVVFIGLPILIHALKKPSWVKVEDDRD